MKKLEFGMMLIHVEIKAFDLIAAIRDMFWGHLKLWPSCPYLVKKDKESSFFSITTLIL